MIYILYVLGYLLTGVLISLLLFVIIDLPEVYRSHFIQKNQKWSLESKIREASRRDDDFYTINILAWPISTPVFLVVTLFRAMKARRISWSAFFAKALTKIHKKKNPQEYI